MTGGGGVKIAIGWDVGGWNCDRNGKSRDALVVLNANGLLMGKPWRGNLRALLNEAISAGDFVRGMLDRCKVPPHPVHDEVVIAIDAPLAFPNALLSLLAGHTYQRQIGNSAANPYLYRFTERRLAEPSSTPLSVVKDMIGSQSTKAIHALRRFTPIQQATGVWHDGGALRIIETYPAACRRRFMDGGNSSVDGVAGHDDIVDAGLCAWVASTFMHSPAELEGPTDDAPPDEGWIWLPHDTRAGAA
ncbi:DUF429 domain-containing protein [Bosea sp. RAC05]|uniref:DUF429 domain-containing protein n=1 Tax=Bosea sp. RAC05 TaxID=1842539 RepID=UPI00083DF432|nr:DUF429 domain-containing protein [Bosea sp. RAC05]AOG04114.1 hypothetical protein BSY19_2995 [Bosea sp. RAC05]